MHGTTVKKKTASKISWTWLNYGVCSICMITAAQEAQKVAQLL